MKTLYMFTLLLMFVIASSPAQNYLKIRIGSELRSAKIYLPEFNDSTDSPSLIIALHGYTTNPKDLELSSQIHQACLNNYIVVYPRGSKNDNGYFGWNAGGMYKEWTKNANDIQYIDSLINLLVLKYKIDQKRIYIMGHSNGAMMAYKLAAQLPTKIAAVACISGPMLDSIHIPLYPVSIMHIHGDNDLVIPHNGTEQYGFHIPSIDETFKMWIEWNHCSTVPSVLKYNKQVTALKWTGNAEVNLFLIHGLGHDWPNKKNIQWDATKIILDFFKEQVVKTE